MDRYVILNNRLTNLKVGKTDSVQVGSLMEQKYTQLGSQARSVDRPFDRSRYVVKLKWTVRLSLLTHSYYGHKHT